MLDNGPKTVLLIGRNPALFHGNIHGTDAGQNQLIERITNMNLTHPSVRLLIAECRREGLLRNECAYVLATAHWESGQFKWMREIWGPTATQKRYEGRKDLGNTQPGDGKRYMGRGFVMITGRRNYTDWATRLGIDLINKPELAEQPAIAVQIIVKGMKLGTFTGKKLSDYITLKTSNFVGARRIVNGTDKATQIADLAKQYDALLKADGYGEGASNPDMGNPITPKQSLLSLLFQFLSNLFGGSK